MQEWRKQPIHFSKKEGKWVLADGTRKPVDYAKPSPPPIDSQLYDYNLKKLLSKEFHEAAAKESIGGNVFSAGYGPNRAAVNSAVDSNGKIIAFSPHPQAYKQNHNVIFVINFDDMLKSKLEHPSYIERVIVRHAKDLQPLDEAKMHALIEAVRQANQETVRKHAEFVSAQKKNPPKK